MLDTLVLRDLRVSGQTHRVVKDSNACRSPVSSGLERTQIFDHLLVGRDGGQFTARGCGPNGPFTCSAPSLIALLYRLQPSALTIGGRIGNGNW